MGVDASCTADEFTKYTLINMTSYTNCVVSNSSDLFGCLTTATPGGATSFNSSCYSDIRSQAYYYRGLCYNENDSGEAIRYAACDLWASLGALAHMENTVASVSGQCSSTDLTYLESNNVPWRSLGSC